MLNSKKNITIDLKGKTMNRNRTGIHIDGEVLLVNGGTLTVRNGTLTGVRENSGGGIYSTGTLTLENVKIENYKSNRGGGIVSYSALLLDGCTISKNSCQTNGESIWTSTDKTVTITNTVISGNKTSGVTSSKKGGGIYIDNGTVSVEGCTVSDNASGDGAGIYVKAGTTLNISGTTTIKDNQSFHYGGGITNCGTVNVTGDLTVTGNKAKANGGGIYSSGTLKVQDKVNITGNTSEIGTNNLFLKDGKTVTLTGALSSGSKVYISGVKSNTALTSGWKKYMGEVEPGEIISNDGLDVLIRDGDEIKAYLYYIRRSWNEAENKVVDIITPITENPKKITSSSTSLVNDDGSDEGWYIVDSDVTINEQIWAIGNINIILLNGYTFTCTNSLSVPLRSSLSIYGQVGDAGTLVSHYDHYWGNAAAIGGGVKEGSSGAITIYGGTVKTENLSDGGAGIGSGPLDKTAGPIKIYGGNVTALGGSYAAGIGGGYGENTSCTINISGGEVEATGDLGGAAIGAGRETKPVDASPVLMGGECKGDATVRITGGTVKLVMISSNEEEPAQVIGHGAGGSKEGTLIIDDSKYFMVTKNGTSVTYDKRISTCRISSNDGISVMIKPCDHPADGITYTSTANAHTGHCKYCNKTFDAEAHKPGSEGKCTVCGYNTDLYTVTFAAGGAAGTMTAASVVPDSDYILPECGFTAPENKVFRC